MGWEQWKQKIKNLFLTEVEDEEASPPPEAKADKQINKQHTYQHVQSKVKYQYPNKNAFRFPVIPDVPEKPERLERSERPENIRTEKIAEETPAYTRRQVEQEKQQERRRENSSEKPAESHFRKSYEPDKKPVRKESNKPFKPTEVPSPIYGFRNRKQQQIEDVPAFMRKEETAVQQEAAVTREENSLPEAHTFSAEIQYVSHDAEMEEKTSKQDTQAEAYLEPEKHEVFPVETETDTAAFSADEKEVCDKEQEETDISSASAMSEEAATAAVIEPEQPVQRPQTNAAAQPKQVPFNVMMTPLDKKKLMDRERAAQQKSQQQTVPEQKQVSVPYHLLDDPDEESHDDQAWITSQQELLEKTLKHFKVHAKVVNTTQGPSVTRFEVQPELGVKVSKVRNLSDDLKLNMAAKDIRIEAPIPGKNTIGIEVPNPEPQMVGLQEVFETDEFKENDSPLAIALGLDIEGAPAVTNIAKMPHGLIAGATGSGKSVCINTILISLLYKAHHDDVKFLLIDPKMVELAPYNDVPHLVSPVITDVKAATAALKWAVAEMEERYEKFVEEGVRDIERYNQKIKQQGRPQEKMPFIVIVIDELADLMMVSPQDVEDAICRIAQKARACGIHLLVATQRPSVDVITGLIKANIPTRIAFSVSSQVDSRTIIDNAGAEKLLGRGDMLFVENGAGKSVRLQGAFVSDDEIERVASYARSIAPPEYLFEQEQLLEKMTVDEEEDVLLHQAIRFVAEQNNASTSQLQRQFKIGYNRAARLIDTLENKGIISQQNGSKPREVLLTGIQLEEMLQQ
jgi:S-DNA-T family DNA segregation ATPase FtsK/SpoIIIE